MRGRLIVGVLLGLVLPAAIAIVGFYITRSNNPIPGYYSDSFVMAPQVASYPNFQNQTPTVQTITLMHPQQTQRLANQSLAKSSSLPIAQSAFGAAAQPALASNPPIMKPTVSAQPPTFNQNSANGTFASSAKPSPSNSFATANRPFQPQQAQKGSNATALRSPQQQPARNPFSHQPNSWQFNRNTATPIRANSNQSFGQPNRAVGSNGFNSSNASATPQKFPTIYEQVIKGMPASANNVKALVRAKYSVSEADATKLAEVLAEADSLVETSMSEDELTMTCSQDVHMAVSRFISTFLTNDGVPSNLSGPERVDSVRFHNNIQRQVTQASYESVFEPTSLGFAPSAEDVKVLLRADYKLPADKAKLFESLLKTKSRLLLEANLNSVDELASNETATLTVTTTRAGQLAVAHLIDALFSVEEAEAINDADEKVSDEKVSDEKVSDEKVSDEKVSEEESSERDSSKEDSEEVSDENFEAEQRTVAAAEIK